MAVKIIFITDQYHIKPEIDYVCKLISSMYHVNFVMADISSIPNTGNVSIAYCEKRNFSELPKNCRMRIIPDTASWERYLDRKECPLTLCEYEEICVIRSSKSMPQFDTTQSGITTDLDLFCSSFFLVSRYEESYDSVKLDNHGRYAFSNSIISEKWIDVPLVNCYMQKLITWIETVYGMRLVQRETAMGAVISYDIDQPFYYLAFLKQLREVSSAGFSQNIKECARYFAHLFAIRPDPYDVFDYLMNVEIKQNIRSTYFILTNTWGLRQKKYMNILRRLKDYGNELSLHVGNHEITDVPLIEYEKESLRKLIPICPEGSRIHFLKINVPGSYGMFTQTGFSYDSTLGYAEREGFRAGICTPFKPYDFEKRTLIDLIEIPLTVMDSTLINYRKYSPKEAYSKIIKLINAVESIGGVIVFNRHNHLLTRAHLEWRNVLEKSIDYLIEKGAQFYTCSELSKKWRGYWKEGETLSQDVSLII